MSTSTTAPDTVDRAATSAASTPQQPIVRIESQSDAHWVRYLADLATGAIQAAHSTQAVQTSPWLFVPIAIMLLGVAVFSVRQLMGLYAVAVLRRQSIAVDDARLRERFDSLRRRFACRPVELRQSDGLSAAATIGWWRPAVLLPAEWPRWTADELSAVLAHELAHVVRHDFLFRFVAALAAAVHFYHPLVRRLFRRLVLDQEFAADALAARAIGDRTDYLCALSTLVLRQDTRRASTTEIGLLPVSSTFLMRRIEMLRAKDGSPNPRQGMRSRWMAIGLLTLVALAAINLRSPAQSSEEESPKRDSATAPLNEQSPSNEQSPKTSSGSDGESDRGIFQRGTIDPALLPPVYNPAPEAPLDECVIAFRAPYVLISALMLSPAEKTLTNWIQMVLDPKSDDPPVTVEDVELVVVRFIMGPGNQGAVVPNLIRFRTKRDLSSIVKRLNSHIPENNGSTIHRIDERTLVFHLTAAPADLSLPVRYEYPWSSHWRAVDGGLITLAGEFDILIEQILSPDRNSWPLFFKELTDHAGVFTLGIDMVKDSGRLVTRLRIVGQHDDSIPKIQQSLMYFLGQYKAGLSENKPTDQEEVRDVMLTDNIVGIFLKAVSTANVERKYLDIRFELPADLVEAFQEASKDRNNSAAEEKNE